MVKETYDNITSNPILLPDNTWIKAFDYKIGPFMSSAARLLNVAIKIFWTSFTSKNA